MLHSALRSFLLGCFLSVLALASSPAYAALSSPSPAPTSTASQSSGELYLVTLVGPGTSGGGTNSDLMAAQDSLLASVQAPPPTYRWTTALSGFAVHLDPLQAAALAANPSVALVEPNAYRPLAGVSAPRAAGPLRVPAVDRPREGGAGIVVGVIDTGIAPDSPAFADSPGLGREPTDFRGNCSVAADDARWSADPCNRKLVAAHYFVSGFGAAAVRSSESLSPLDVVGHGTQVASVVVGNARVSVGSRINRSGSFGGVAPQARLAVYKACWSAPDPSDDGCATADLVSAIDLAVRERVDVLNLSVGGSDTYDTVERALLGAAEADIVVVAAAGNQSPRDNEGYAAHVSPWTTTVGGLAGGTSAGVLRTRNGPTLHGASRALGATSIRRIVRGGDAAAPGVSKAEARRCTPGSLNAAAVTGRIVVCERGEVARVEKSATVRTAGGVAMVLLNVRPGVVADDLHAVPTVHLDALASRELSRWLAHQPRARGQVVGVEASTAPLRAARWSAVGNPVGGLVKPDLTAPGSNILGAVPATDEQRWDVFTGTSAAAAQVSGTAALVRAAHRDWSAAAVRSAMTTSTAPLSGEVLRIGAGVLRPQAAVDPGLVFDQPIAGLRAYLDGTVRGSRLNTASVVLTGAQSVTRRVRNVSGRATYWSAQVSGTGSSRVRITPAAMTIPAGGTRTFRVSATPGAPVSATLVWTSGTGTTVRVPVALGR